MSLFSETLGSFIRNGNFPLEANFVFDTEANMKAYYSDAANQATMYEGMVRIVSDGLTTTVDLTGATVTVPEQLMWWCVKNATTGVLEMQQIKFSTDVSSSTIAQDVSNIKTYVDAADNAIKALITLVTGNLTTKDAALDVTIGANTNSIQDILQVLYYLYGKLFADSHDFLVLLQQEKYKNYHDLSEEVYQQHHGTSAANTPITTDADVVNFLSGFVNGLNLYDVIWNRVVGSATPQVGYATIVEVANKLQLLETTLTQLITDYHTELNKVEAGVGLDASGDYENDTTANYIAGATSVANALHILDAQLKVATDKVSTITANNPDSCIELDITTGANNSYTITPQLNLSADINNQLSRLADGLFVNSELSYANGILTHTVNGNVKSAINLNINSILQEAHYDNLNELLVFTFTAHNGTDLVVNVPVSSMIRTWLVKNDYPTKAVELTKEVNIGGDDLLSADVRISDNPHNILVRDVNKLLVDGRASNISYGNISVLDKLDAIDTNLLASNTTLTSLNTSITAILQDILDCKDDIADNTQAITAEVTRATLKESDLTDAINDLDTRLTTLEATVTQAVNDLAQLATDTLNSLDDLLARVVELERTNTLYEPN